MPWMRTSSNIEGIGGRLRQHRLFRRGRCVHGDRVSRTSAAPAGCTTRSGRYPPETMLSHTFYESKPGEFFRLLPGQDAGPGRPAQRRPPEAGRVGAGGKAEGGHHPEHRRPAPGGRQPTRCWSSTAACYRNHCTRCGKVLRRWSCIVQQRQGVPRCSCGGVIKPDVVLYEEALDEDVAGRGPPVHRGRRTC